MSSPDDRVARMEAALRWYADTVQHCNRFGHDLGDPARAALAKDLGHRAREALAPDDPAWAAMLESRRRAGEDVDHPTYREVLQRVWDTRGERHRGFKDIPGALVGECGLCYRESETLVCGRCRDSKLMAAVRVETGRQSPLG